jgi:hypothetical protein
LLSIRLLSFSKRHSALLLSMLVSFSMLAVYLSVAPTRLTNANFGSDGGDLLAAVLTRGIPHPSGYPTYTLLGRLFQLIPASTPVFRASLESLVPAALAAGLLTAWMVFILGSKTLANLLAALLAGTAWGVAPLLFSQAVIIEVHGLQALLIMLAFWWISLNLDNTPGKHVKPLLGLSLLVGLGFGNHLLIALLVPAFILAMLYFARRSRDWKLVLVQLGLVICGMLVYLYLPLAARGYPAVNWGNPQTWPGFIWETSADPYQGLLFRASTPVLWERLRSVASLLLEQFGVLGLLAGAIGVIHAAPRIKSLRWVLVWTFLAYLAFAIGYRAQDSVDYLIPAAMVFAMWIGLAVPGILKLNWKRIPLGSLLVIALMLSIWVRLPGTRSRVDPRALDQPAQYAEQLLKEAPERAIVYTTTDQDSFPLWYYHFGLGQRPDLRLVSLPLTQFVWYQQTLVHTYADLSYPALYTTDLPNADWGKAIAPLNQGRPVCDTRLSSESETGIAFQCSLP